MSHSATSDKDGTVTRFFWVRHAPVAPEHRHYIYGNRDVPAVTSDRKIFDGLAAALPADAVWLTTHLMRTRQTRDAIAAAAARATPATTLPEPTVERAFAEQDFGQWQGLTHDELAAAKDGAHHRFWLAPAHQSPPGGESFSGVYARVAEAIERRAIEHRGRDMVIVAHGGSIRAAVGHALGLDPERMLALSVENLSVTLLVQYATKGQSVWRMTKMNAMPHRA